MKNGSKIFFQYLREQFGSLVSRFYLSNGKEKYRLASLTWQRHYFDLSYTRPPKKKIVCPQTWQKKQTRIFKTFTNFFNTLTRILSKNFKLTRNLTGKNLSKKKNEWKISSVRKEGEITGKKIRVINIRKNYSSWFFFSQPHLSFFPFVFSSFTIIFAFCRVTRPYIFR